MAIADGEISEKERGIILRKAEKVGEDKDEVEMILEGKLAMMNNQKRPEVEKAGNVTKCPQCKANVPSFTTKCEFCGHEFRNIDSISSITKLADLLLNAEGERKEKSTIGMIFNNTNSKVHNKKMDIINNFPVPNSKEDILEFLATATPKAKAATKLTAMLYGGEGKEKYEMAKTWKSKCEQIIIKAGFSFKNDPKTMEEIRYYAKELKIKMK